MKKTTLIIVLMLGLGCSMNMHAQTCKDIIFPDCGNNENRLIPKSSLPLKSFNATCDSVEIINPPEYGTLTIDSFGNVIDTIRGLGFLYEPSTNCLTDLTDTFEIEIYDDADSLCESVMYILHFVSNCERPDDIFCCITPNDTSSLYVLANDSTFIETIYSDSTYTIEDILASAPRNGILVPPFNNPYTYLPNPGFTGLDSFSYEVTYTIITTDGDTITICDEPTCYIQVDDCLHTMSDTACIMADDTVCLDPLVNDIVEAPIFNDPVLDSIGCTNTPLPEIDPTILTMPIPIDGGTVPWEDGNGNWCFTHKSTGTYTYTYDICTDAGGCATDSIVITVNDGVPCPLCDSTLSINNTYNNGDEEYFEATESIISTATINAGADVTFDAGNFILLKGVFLADKGAVFLAKIDGCDNYPEGVTDDKGDESSIISVFNNYPNPFTGQTTIQFTLTADLPVTLLVFDSLGRKVATLLDAIPTLTGIHEATFDGTNYSSGVYYYTIQAGEFLGTQKMILVK